MEAHLCKNCYEINKGYHLLKNEQKRCDECGGVVFSLQEAADYIADQDSRLRIYEGEDIG
jgi:hypothetical protein